MIKTFALVLVLLVGALLIYAATRPDTLAVQRTASINASADKIHPLIADMHQFNTWNPYHRKDPAMKGTYSGPSAGPGAGFAFEGNKDVGKGSLKITEVAAPSRVAMELHMLEPMEGTNQIEFTLVPQGQSTQVTWAMRCTSPYIAKLMGIFINMDQMIGRDFEAGLANLKAVAERG